MYKSISNLIIKCIIVNHDCGISKLKLIEYNLNKLYILFYYEENKLVYYKLLSIRQCKIQMFFSYKSNRMDSNNYKVFETIILKK